MVIKSPCTLKDDRLQPSKLRSIKRERNAAASRSQSRKANMLK